jgi:dTDP-4-dehydrorhamnose 3,5-epimerase-like enzyme
MNFNEDDRAQRYLDVFDLTQGQINISVVSSTTHVVAWHAHPYEEYWCCLKGAFKIGVHDGKTMQFAYLSDRNPVYMRLAGGVYHGYKCLQPGSILLYYFPIKYDPALQTKKLPGYFGENWEIENK